MVISLWKKIKKIIGCHFITWLLKIINTNENKDDKIEI